MQAKDLHIYIIANVFAGADVHAWIVTLNATSDCIDNTVRLAHFVHRESLVGYKEPGPFPEAIWADEHIVRC
jgi:hypothetical protein